MALGSVAQAAQKPAMTTSAQFGQTSFDNSGFTVNVAGPGGNATTTASNDRSGLANMGALLKNPLVLIALAVGVYYVMGKK